MFRGLFVGVDRYAFPDVNWLTCAARDARALHALFLDSLGGDGTLLVDDVATRSAISDGFADLARAGEDDFVAVVFSGHGTPTHELAPHDADPHRPTDTLVSADDLAAWLSAIPARNLLVILDCCFSGGFGAKVLQTDIRSRDGLSAFSKLDHIAGAGRVILTASSANEEAYEHQGLGHGIFTDQVLRALRGAPEVVESGRISLYRLLEFVTRRVGDDARALGRTQQPTMRGSLDGEVAWPVFEPGPRYRAAFPDRTPTKATSAIQSLADLGFPAALIAAWAGEIPSLNELQLAAINDYGLLDGEHLVASAPTSSGKTMLGELAALQGALRRRRAIFLLPLKALVHDKKRQFDRLYGAFGIRTVEATGETEDISPLLRGRYDLALLTYEKFLALAITYPHVLDQVGTVVVDEVQMIADDSRGANLEFLLTLLLLRRQQGSVFQVIALSAVIGDTKGLERWLGGRLLRRSVRPVPLDEGLLLADGRFRYFDGATGEERVSGPLIRRRMIKDSSQDWVIPLVQRLVREGKRVIVFREETGGARGCADYLAASLALPPADDALSELPPGDPSRSSGALRDCLRGGVAFHTSHLAPGERQVVEEHFRKPGGRLRVIAATTTLAMGVNTPAEAVVIVGLQHPPQKPYSVAEYKNLAGRAGRLGYSEHGASYLLALTPRDEHDLWQRYVTAAPEDLRSRFLDADPRTMIVRLVAAARNASRGRAAALTADEIIHFLQASFGAFLRVGAAGSAWRWNRGSLEAALADLARNGLVSPDSEGRYELTALGALSGESGTEVASVVRVVAHLRALAPDQITDPVVIALAQITVEADQVRMPFNKLSTRAHHKEPQAWFGELANQRIPSSVLSALRREMSEPGQDVMRAKKAVACLLYVHGHDMLHIENVLTRFGGSRDGIAGPVRATTARTCDVLAMVGRAAELVHPDLSMVERTERLVVRLDLGVGAAVAELAQYVGRALDRSDYWRLAAADLGNPDRLAATGDRVLLDLFSGNAVKATAVINACAEIAATRAKRAEEVAPSLEPYVA